LSFNRKAALSVRGLQQRSGVILDRHPLWLDALNRLLAGVGIEVLGRTTDEDEAVGLVAAHRPDLFIAGIDPASSEQVACIRKAAESHPGLKLVVVADNREPEAINAALAAGATVYCVKTAHQEDLVSAIRQAFERSIYIATHGHAFSSKATSAEREAADHDLTRRELEILQLVSEGHSNSQLARMLWVTEQTVKFHLSNIYRKLDVANRTEASRWAQLNGLLPAQREQEQREPALSTTAA
jgi:DNA-binding NarL/FixJ family response regulator